MRKIYMYRIILVISLVTLVFSSCKWFAERKAPRGKNIVCLVDFSDSRNATERLDFYMNAIRENILSSLNFHDKISILPIDKASITNSNDILLKDLSAMEFEPETASPMEEEQITKDNLKRYKDTLSLEFVTSFRNAIAMRSKSNHGTDIFGALEVVKGKLRSEDDNYLIFLSDMMNWSTLINMEPNNKRFSYKTLEKHLDAVPNYEMSNVTALVLTAEQVEVSADHFQLVQEFWTKYFERNKIRLFDYNSASVSKLNELMALPVVQDQQNSD